MADAALPGVGAIHESPLLLRQAAGADPYRLWLRDRPSVAAQGRGAVITVAPPRPWYGRGCQIRRHCVYQRPTTAACSLPARKRRRRLVWFDGYQPGIRGLGPRALPHRYPYEGSCLDLHSRARLAALSHRDDEGSPLPGRAVSVFLPMKRAGWQSVGGAAALPTRNQPARGRRRRSPCWRVSRVRSGADTSRSAGSELSSWRG